MTNNNKPKIHVVAAVIRNGFGKILLAQRLMKSSHLPGYWEFPGGKVEDGESAEQALVRELQEEISITATKITPLIKVPFSYPEKDVVLDVWEVDQYMGEVKPLEGQEISWVTLDCMREFQLPPADLPVVTALKLPDKYLITPEPAGNSEKQFLHQLELSLQEGVQLVQLRSKKLNTEELCAYAEKSKQVCHKYGAKILINSDIKVYRKCGLDGIHLNSEQLALSVKRENSSDLIAASCHSWDDLKMAEDAGVDFAMLSPVKQTATHPGAKPIGWDVFSQTVMQCVLPVFALGGLESKDIAESKRNGAQGVAAIRGLWISAK